MKFTQTVVDKLALPPGKKDVIAWDDSLPGFGFRLREGGSKKPVIQYKIGAKTRRMTTKLLPLEQARKWAKKELGKVANGADPQGEKHAVRATATETFKAIAERFIAYQTSRLRPSSLYSTTLYLTKYCRRLHDLKIEVISRREIASVLATIANDHGPVAADSAGSALSALFAWAMGEGLVDANPVIRTNKYAGRTSRDRVLKDAEIGAIWLALDDDDFGQILKLLILTGQRRNEISDLRRGEIVDSTIELPGERTKNGRSHVVPLSDAAAAIIEQARGDREMVFGKREGGFSGWSKAKLKLDAKLQGMAPWTLHDIRRSVATGMAELGVEPHIVEAILNHVSGHRAGVAGIYNRATYLEPKTAALNLWANHIAVIVAKASGANVEQLQTRSRPIPRTHRRD